MELENAIVWLFIAALGAIAVAPVVAQYRRNRRARGLRAYNDHLNQLARDREDRDEAGQ